MTKFIASSLVILACATAGAAENASMRANIGVGFGTTMFEALEADGLMSQTAASFTNTLFFNQAFAITTGSLGAKKTDKIVDNRELKDYVRDNLDVLAREIAAGSGEALVTLAELSGVAEADRAAFYARLQSNYASIFTSSDVTSDQVLENIGRTMV